MHFNQINAFRGGYEEVHKTRKRGRQIAGLNHYHNQLNFIPILPQS
jgi:hypothetical protein